MAKVYFPHQHVAVTRSKALPYHRDAGVGKDDRKRDATRKNCWVGTAGVDSGYVTLIGRLMQ
jgi:hypothetical protein